MTYVYLFRHGIAIDRELCPHDRDRELTAEGRKKTRTIGEKLYQLGLRASLILTSPLVRAHQTAQILADCLQEPPLEVVEWLAPEGDFAAWEAWHDSHRGVEAVFLVGHEPDLSSWAEVMTWGQVSGNILLKKAGLIGLVTYPDQPLRGTCTLFLLLPPKILLGL
ncbi:MAG: phosphohistidine phosphatase SixA [Pseudanabaenaceae cyanobacterium]